MIASVQPANSFLSSEFIFMVSQFLSIIPIMGKTTQKGVFFMIGMTEHSGLRHRAAL